MVGGLSKLGAACRLLAVSLLAGLLAGCWYSEAPLIDASNASVFAHTGKYADPEGGEQPMVIAAKDDGSYDLVGPDSTVNAWFLTIGSNWYVYQMDADDGGKGEPEKGPEGAPQAGEEEKIFLFNVMHYDGGSLYMYDPDCDEQTAAIDGIEDDGHSGCRIASVEALKAAGLKFVAAIEKGQITGEPQVFRRSMEK